MQETIDHLPIDDIQLDKLGFREQSEKIATFINNFSSRIPYAMSINGSWGAGKSTMLNFIEGNLDHNKCKVIRFNPWMISDREELIKSLFEEIYFVIDSGYTNTKEKFIKYAQKIVPPATKVVSYLTAITHGAAPGASTALSNASSEAAKGITDLIFDKPLSKRKQELQDEMELMLGENYQKIVVIIDELDRLFPEEVITVFQMIKSSLDFPGLLFVVAMDEEVVFDALTKKGVSKPEYYLQKIFQRKYYINTKHQIRTLTDHFIMQRLDVNKEAEQALTMALKTYIYVEEENFIKSHLENANYYDPSLGEEWEIKMPLSEAKTRSTYFEMHRLIRDNINLQNPRNFVNFSEILLEHWNDYYDYIFKEVPKIPCYVQIAFLIFVSHYSYPNYTEISSFSRNYRLSDSTPNFVLEVQSHLNYILPVFKSTNVQQNQYGQPYSEEKTPSSIIKKSIFYLSMSPDYVKIYNI